MSAVLQIDDPVKYKEIINTLTLIPVDKEAEQKKKWNFKSNISVKPKDPIHMYILDYVENKLYLRVPFRFACGYLGKLANRDREYPSIDYDFKIALRPHQHSIVQEAYLQLYSCATTSLNIYTGGGKTIMSAYLISQAKCIACVLINLQSLISSWYNTFTICFPDLKDRIWIVGQGEMPDNVAIIICMDERISKIPDDIRKQIGCMVVDEAHLFATQSKVRTLLTLEPKYVIICTATLERNDGMEVMIHSIAGKHCVTRYSEKPFRLFRLNTKIRIPETLGTMGLNYGEFIKEQANTLERNLIAANIIHGNPDHKYMIYCKTKEHVENLSTLFKHYGMEYDTLYGTKKKLSEKKILLFSISKAGTGFDLSAYLGEVFSGVPPDVLILMSSMKSANKLTQVLGRVLRSDNPTFIYLVDNNNVVKRHYKEAETLYKVAKASIIEVDYDSATPGGGIKLD
jgi:superfamily II DNA or RNA helicase